VIVRAMPPERFSWLAERAKLTIHPGFGALEAVNDRGETVGAVGFDGWWPGAVAMHVALEHPAALRHLLRPSFGVVFDAPPRGFGKAAATATVYSTNDRSLALVRHVGFRHVHTGRDYAGSGVHVEFFEMTRAECRWIPLAMRRAA
jgi:hypothetical protein